MQVSCSSPSALIEILTPSAVSPRSLAIYMRWPTGLSSAGFILWRWSLPASTDGLFKFVPWSGRQAIHEESQQLALLVCKAKGLAACEAPECGIQSVGHDSPVQMGLTWARHVVLVTHISGGIVALLVGPWQFSGPLRRRYLRVHRLMGRIYLVSVGVAAVAALQLAITTRYGRRRQASTCVL